MVKGCWGWFGAGLVALQLAPARYGKVMSGLKGQGGVQRKAIRRWICHDEI